MIINGRNVGPGNPPLVIAELGINHGGSLATAKDMVTMAAKAGAECVKHQTHFVEDEMTEEAKTVFPPNATASIWEVIEEAVLAPEEELELKRHAESLGLIYLSTPFSRKAANFLRDIDIPAFKIGSGEADNIPLIRHIAQFGKPVIMSTGMHSIESIRESVDIFRTHGIPFALLECTNLYPSPPENVSLAGVTELKQAFPDAVIGFSDHSIGPHMAIASVALGACVIERHFTDTRYRIGPDIACSMDPAELRLLIDRVNEVYAAMGNPKKRSPPEERVYLFARGSIVADRKLVKGERIVSEAIWARRPGTGEIPASKYDELIGRRVNRDIEFNEQLRWSDLYLDEQ